MKALLIKDLMTLSKTIRFLLFFMLIFACIPGLNMGTFVMVYCAMLPVTAVAYDERSKWDAYAAMMPYQPRQIVLSKYVLGYVAVALAMVLSMLARAAIGVFGGESLQAQDYLLMLLYAMVTTVFMAVTLPLIFRFGAEKGRLVLLVGVAIGISAFSVLAAPLARSLENMTFTPLQLFLLVTVSVVLLNSLSMLLSCRFYGRKYA
ncbi:MAG: ABC-2 transporter permease [Christensenellaceae bacterium]|nr:ABC-2 transporter permease [Christensenellaceae bacterium]